jgi:hypothetical protein
MHLFDTVRRVRRATLAEAVITLVDLEAALGRPEEVD